MLLSTAACSSHSSPTPTDFHLQPPPPGMSPCPSPTPFFQQLYHAVAYMEQELGESPAHICNSPYPLHDLSRPLSPFSYTESPAHKHADTAARVSVPQCVVGSGTLQVNSVPYPHHTDLDDISQPDIGGTCDHLSGAEQASLSETESEASVKKEGLHDTEGEPLETPYLHHDEVEEFGSVIIFSIYVISVNFL